MKKNNISQLEDFNTSLKNVERYMEAASSRHAAFTYVMWAFVMLLGFGFMSFLWAPGQFETISEPIKGAITMAFWFGMALFIGAIGYRLFAPKYKYAEKVNGNRKEWRKKGRKFGISASIIWTVFAIGIVTGGLLLQDTYNEFAWGYVVYFGLLLAVLAMYLAESIIFKNWKRSVEHVIVVVILTALSPMIILAPEGHGLAWLYFTFAISVAYLGGGLYGLYSAEKSALPTL
ncbi:MAG: hypothetical protein JSV49_05565 [Thermoplasmata archaeon]|nr:MAG: hypothetical protein JSV49_05565 [Thermoplasmata archaeon]